MRNKVLVVALALAAAGAAPAHAAEVTVSQGDRIRVGDATYCTLGFNDRPGRVGYTAAHCGRGGDRVAVQVAGEFIEAGTFYPSSAYGASVSGNDWALIRWDQGVTLGENRVTGDTVIAPTDIQPTDRLCTYGAATAAPSCGAYAGTIGGNVYWDQSPATVGDSGGPVFVDGRRGFVGVLSGHSVVSSPTAEHTVLRAAAPADRPAPTSDDEIQLISAFYRDHQAAGLIVSTPIVRATDAAANIAGRVEQRWMERSSTSESSWQAGTLPVIAAILVGSLVASTPALVELIGTVRSWRS